MREILLAVLTLIGESHVTIGPIQARGLGLVILMIALFEAPALVWRMLGHL